MIVSGLEITILEEYSHQSVLAEGYRFEFIYNSLIDRYFVNIYENEELIFGSIKIVPNIDIFNFLDVGELVVISDDEYITRDNLSVAKVIYIAKVEDAI